MDKVMARIDTAFGTLSRLLITMRMSAYVISTYAIVQGAMILVGGPARFSAPAYDTASNISGAPQVWGITIGLCGIAALVGVKNRMYPLGALGMTVAAVWSTLFAVSFAISAFRFPEANLTAIAVYGKDAILFTLMASAYRDMWHQHLKDEQSNDEEG